MSGLLAQSRAGKHSQDGSRVAFCLPRDRPDGLAMLEPAAHLVVLVFVHGPSTPTWSDGRSGLKDVAVSCHGGLDLLTQSRVSANAMAVCANQIALSEFSKSDALRATAQHRARICELRLSWPMVEIHAFRWEGTAAIHAWMVLDRTNPVGSLTLTERAYGRLSFPVGSTPFRVDDGQFPTHLLSVITKPNDVRGHSMLV
jgi:hypothetical protein